MNQSSAIPPVSSPLPQLDFTRSVERGDQVGYRRSRVRRRRERKVAEHTVSSDDGVGTKLVDVFSRVL